MTADARRKYAENIAQAAGIKSTALVEALKRVPRERFLPAGPWTVMAPAGPAGTSAVPGRTPDDDPLHLYQDASVALDEGRQIYNGQPSTVLPILDSLEPRPGDTIFHLGAGTGYYTALLASAVGPRGRLLACEVDEALGTQARHNLRAMSNVTLQITDGAALDPGPCDAILVHAGVTAPRELWCDRLNVGGRLLLPLTFGFPGSPLGKGAFFRIRRLEHANRFEASLVRLPVPLMIYSCKQLSDDDSTQRILSAYQTGLAASVRSLRRDAHPQATTCWLHSTDTLCLSTVPPLEL